MGDTGVIRAFMRNRNDLSMQTKALYENKLRKFVGWMVESGLDPIVKSITGDVAEQYIESRMETCKTNTVRSEIIMLRSFGKYLATIVETSPTAGLRIPDADDTNKRALTDDELKRLLVISRRGENGPRNHAIIAVAAGCGLRRGELVALRWNDISWDESTITVQGPTSKSKKHRKVTMHHEISKALDGLWAVMQVTEEAPVFINRLMRPLGIEGLVAAIRTMGREAGVDLTAHMLRHTWATNYQRVRSGDFVQFNREAGWTDKQNRMAMRYVHERPAHERLQAPSPLSVLDGPRMRRVV